MCVEENAGEQTAIKQTHRPPRSIYPAQNRHMRRRTRVLAGLVAVLCFGGLLARLFTLQILDPSGYANRAAAQQLRDTTLPAARGEIYSADRVSWPPAKPAGPSDLPRDLADQLVQPAAKALSEILDIDYDATLQKLSKRTSNDCLLRRPVDADLAERVRAWCAQNNAQGIRDFADTQRICRATLWAACWALPMWIIRAFGGWNCNMTPN